MAEERILGCATGQGRRVSCGRVGGVWVPRGRPEGRNRRGRGAGRKSALDAATCQPQGTPPHALCAAATLGMADERRSSVMHRVAHAASSVLEPVDESVCRADQSAGAWWPLQVSWLGSLALHVFDRFARAAISVGHLRIVLPNGEELSYGDPSTAQPPVASGGRLSTFSSILLPCHSLT